MATSLEGSYEGLLPFDWPAANKPLNTWYRVFGDLSSSITPLIVIHGGPGFVHNYLLNHRALTDKFNIPVIFYDQIGSGNSTHLPETASSRDYPDFWTVDIFNEQLRQLVTHLKIGGSYDILGHSWGGMMASHFAHLRPVGLRRLLLVNAAASKSRSTANRITYRQQLPQEWQDVLNRAEKENVWDSKEASMVLLEFAKRHFCTVYPFPEDYMESEKKDDDPTVSIAIGDQVGSNPFKNQGYMAAWTMEGKARLIEVPTLVVNGIGEVASGDAVKPFLDEIPDVKLVTIEDTTHSPHIERKEEYMKVLGNFLTWP